MGVCGIARLVVAWIMFYGRDYPRNYVLLQVLRIRYVVSGIMSDYVLLQGLSIGCFDARITHEMCCCRSCYIIPGIIHGSLCCLREFSMGLCVVAWIIHEIMCYGDYPWDFVLLRQLSMGLCVVSGVIHGIICGCRDYPSMGLCVVAGIIHDIILCGRMEYPWDYVVFQGLSMILCVVAGLIHDIMCGCRAYP